MPEYIKFEPLRDEILNDVEYDGDTVNYFLGIVDSQPAADVAEVKHGEWVNVQDFGGGKCFADCSICGTQEKAPNPTALKMFRRYCPYCGAKMDLKEGAK